MKGGKISKSKKETDTYIPQPPQLPKQERAPWINIETSTYGEDLGKLLDNEYEHDVIFEVDKNQIYSHKLILQSSSTYFRKIITDHERDIEDGIVRILEPDESFETVKKVPEKKIEVKEIEKLKNVNNDVEDPENFCCPITQDLMVDPVVAQDGHTYEKEAIVAWLEKHGTSPITRDPVDKNILITNRILKSQIEDYIAGKSEKPKEDVPKEEPKKEEPKEEVPNEDKPKKKKKKSKKPKREPSSLPSGIKWIYSRKRIIDEKEKIITHISIKTYSFQTFKNVLEFIYTGEIKEKDVKKLTEIIGAGTEYGLDFLCSFCRNIQDGEDYLNPSIGTYLNDETAKYLIEYYFNKTTYSDFSFDVEDRTILAHKSIVGIRCEVLRRMISNTSFIEGKSGVVHLEDTTYLAFKAFLEYIYSAHCPIQESGNDSVAILALAHEFDITRLITLCELYISKQIEVSTTDGIEKAEIDIIGLLLIAQQYNAKQLEAFLLHFISNNYEPMSKRKEWGLLDGKNIKYVEKHRWPSLSYLQELETYEKEMNGKGEGEKCLVM